MNPVQILIIALIGTSTMSACQLTGSAYDGEYDAVPATLPQAQNTGVPFNNVAGTQYHHVHIC